jgi:hypothetical protein
MSAHPDPESLTVGSRCRLTAKGRIYLDLAHTPRPVPEPTAVPDTRSRSALEFNVTGRFILDLCDGSRSISQVSEDVARVWRISQERALFDVLTFLERLRAQGMVQPVDCG